MDDTQPIGNPAPLAEHSARGDETGRADARDAHASDARAAAARLPLHVDAALTQSLQELADRADVALSTTVLAAWAWVLARVSGRDDATIDLDAGQGDRDTAGGTAHSIDLSGELDTNGLLARAHRCVQPPRVQDAAAAGAVATAPAQAHLIWNAQAQAARSDLAACGLELHLNEHAGMLSGEFVHATALFDQNAIERQRGYLLAALAAMIADPSQALSSVDLLGEDERELLLHTWNRTDADYPDQTCFQTLFEQQARRSPHALALYHDGQRIGYAELNAQANRLAHYLIESGVRPDDRVALCAQRGPLAIVGLLAVLKAGGAYVAFDPAHSSSRLNRMIADASPLLALGDAAGRRAIGDLHGLTWLDLSADQAVWAAHSAADPHVPELRADHLAYIIYTSGSTGVPKGVMVEHRNMVQFGVSQIARFAVDADSRIAQFASLSFDASVFDLTMSLMSGAALYLPTSEERRDSRAYMDWIAAHGITHSYLPPAFLQGRTELPRFATRPMLLVGGEAVAPALLHALGEHANVVHIYGPTETTVLATAWDPPAFPAAFERAPIGRPLANTRAYLLDAQLRPVPLGAPGELYIGGACVTRGYLNQPELTAQRFLADPFDPRPGARMYRSGDLARYQADGQLLFLGRNDHQVKLRGFRIELGEIEARLSEHPWVRECVLLAREDEPGHTRLVAYVVADSGHDRADLAACLRAHLSALLPDYMVPSAFVALAAMPLNANGKIERKALPAPDEAAFAHRRYSPPEGEMEELMAQLWQDLLKLDRVGRDDDFFELGGHSVLAMRLFGRLRSDFEVSVPPSLLFNRPRLADFAEAVLIAALQADAGGDA